MKTTPSYPLEFYAAWFGDHCDRLRSASGGVMPLLGRRIIGQGGVVYGTRWSEGFKAVVAKASSMEELEAFKGSKYVQSTTSPEVYADVVTEVKSGRPVLFSGLPCQIAGLMAKFDRKYENLITVDLICHGVPPQSAFESELGRFRHLLKKHRIDNITFRGNDSHDYNLAFWSGEKCVRSIKGYAQPYFAAYLLGINLKDACYKCPFSRPVRIGDITVGDYIGRGEKNVSCVSLNTPAGRSFFTDVVSDNPKLHVEKRDYNERLRYGLSLVEPVQPGRLHERYVALSGHMSPASSARISLFFHLLRYRSSLLIVAVKRSLGIKGSVFKR